MKLPDSIKNLSDSLTKLPSLGPRQSIRLVFYLLSRGKDFIHNLAEEISALEKIKICERCFFIHQNKNNLCDICQSPSRKQSIIMIVEKETDLLSIENTGKYDGRYLVLGPVSKTGLFEPYQKLRLQNLKEFIKKLPNQKADEIIIGLNPTAIGDFYFALLKKEFESFALKISRLGRGLPTGGEIEFSDDETLQSALEKRS